MIKRFISKLLDKVKRKKSDLSFSFSSMFVERELRQRRIAEKWSVNMMADYYSCTEDQMREVLDYYNIQ